MSTLIDKLKRKADDGEKLKYEYDELVDDANFSNRTHLEFGDTFNELLQKYVKLKKILYKCYSDDKVVIESRKKNQHLATGLSLIKFVRSY